MTKRYEAAEDGKRRNEHCSFLVLTGATGSCQETHWVRGTLPSGYTKKAPGSMPEAFSYHPVRKMGLEPTRCKHHKILSLARLPIPTLPRTVVAISQRLIYNSKNIPIRQQEFLKTYIKNSSKKNIKHTFLQISKLRLCNRPQLCS